MTHEQEKKAEEIIDFIKKHEGFVQLNMFRDIEFKDPMQRPQILKQLQDRGLVEISEKKYNYTLTEYGWAFESFKLIRKEKEKERKLSLREYNLKKWKYYWFWPVAILGAVGGIISLLQIFGII